MPPAFADMPKIVCPTVTAARMSNETCMIGFLNDRVNHALSAGSQRSFVWLPEQTLMPFVSIMTLRLPHPAFRARVTRYI
jgi:hypothetical protein